MQTRRNTLEHVETRERRYYRTRIGLRGTGEHAGTRRDTARRASQSAGHGFESRHLHHAYSPPLTPSGGFLLSYVRFLSGT